MSDSKLVVMTVPDSVPGFMKPMYVAGDQLLVRRTAEPSPGNVVIAIPRREGVIDYFAVAGVFCSGNGPCEADHCDGLPEGCLVPMNRKLPLFPRRDLRVIGVVEGKISST